MVSFAIDNSYKQSQRPKTGRVGRRTWATIQVLT